MKFRIVSSILFICAITFINYSCIECQAAKSVAINQTNFPGKQLRELIKTEFDTNKNNILSAKEIKKATHLSIDVSNDAFIPSDFKGISKLTNLKYLELNGDLKDYCELNKLTSLKKLTINYSGTKKASLDLQNLKNLRELTIFKPGITGLKVPSSLRKLMIYDAGIRILDLRHCKKLNHIHLYPAPKLKMLDVRNCTNLKNLWIVDPANKLKTIKLKNMKKLEELVLDSVPKLEKIDLAQAPALVSLEINSPVTKFDLTMIPRLETLKLTNINRKTLDIRSLSHLSSFTCIYSKVEKIIWENKYLDFVRINNNKLKGTLNLKNLPALRQIDCSDNKLTAIYARNNKKLTQLNCTNNKLKILDLYNVGTSNLYLSCTTNPKLKAYLKDSNFHSFDDESNLPVFDSTATIIYKNKK